MNNQLGAILNAPQVNGLMPQQPGQLTFQQLLQLLPMAQATQNFGPRPVNPVPQPAGPYQADPGPIPSYAGIRG